MSLEKLSHWPQPNWESACKNESRNCAKYQAEVVRLRQALAAIRQSSTTIEMRRIARKALER